MKEHKAVTAAMQARYCWASKKQKGQLLDELIALTGYSRWYAVGLLHGHQSRMQCRQVPPRPRQRPRRYDTAVPATLHQIWVIMDCICGKRMAAVLPQTTAVLERHGELGPDRDVRRKLGAITAASIDRLLAPERRRLNVRGRSGTKPGTLLKHQIPIRIIAEWDQTCPGFVEIDLVGHDGGLSQGDFCQTLDVTEVASGRTETQAVLNRAQIWVFEALRAVRQRLAFTLLGVDSDNGSEFINDHLARHTRQERITFTRGRACKKNDGCYVEQKNCSVVHRAVRYARYDGTADLHLLNQFYAESRLYTNFFQPLMKLIRKERHGADVKKTYDRPRTLFQRLCDSPERSRQAKEQLRGQHIKMRQQGNVDGNV